MKTLQAESDHISKRRGFRFWVSCLTLLLGLPLFLYYGYCWGWWGRSSLLLQYLFQCNCPAASEEARYPESVDVIVSACRNTSVRLSPSGRLLYVQETESRLLSTYLLDLRTGEKIPLTLPDSAFYFLTDDLLYIFVYYEGSEYIFDRTTEELHSIKKFTSASPNGYVNGLVDALHKAKYVFLINDKDTVVALASDFPASSEHNFITDRFDIPGRAPNRVEQFLQENNIIYQTVLASFPDEVISPDGRFVARADGIYLVETGKKIVEGYSASRFYRAYSRKYFKVRGWSYDGSGVIYSKFLNPCLIETNFFIFDDPGCYFEIPQPVLKLKMPEEYLLPAQTP